MHGAGGDGIAIKDGSRCSLTFNDVFGHGERAVAVGCSAAPLICDNKIHASACGVAFVDAGTSGRLLRNLIWNHASACVGLSPGVTPLVSGNSIHMGGRSGIEVLDPNPLLRITGNAIWANGDAGVVLLKGDSPVLTGNFFLANARFGVLLCDPGADDALLGTTNIFSQNVGCDIAVQAGDGSPVQRETGSCDRALCSGCGAAGAALKRCNGCLRFGAPFSPRYCGPACQKAHWKAHKPDCQRAEERADEWLHAMDALLDLPGDPYGDLELLAQRRRQRELEAAEPAPAPSG